MSRAQAKITPTIAPTLSPIAQADCIAPPRWAIDRVGRPAPNGHASSRRAGSITLDVTDGGQFALTTARLIGAADTPEWPDPPKTWLFQHRWEDGDLCPRTGVALERATIGGRTTCWSPARQKLS